MSLRRSTMKKRPSRSATATSPVCSQPSGSIVAAVAAVVAVVAEHHDRAAHHQLARLRRAASSTAASSKLADAHLDAGQGDADRAVHVRRVQGVGGAEPGELGHPPQLDQRGAASGAPTPRSPTWRSSGRRRCSGSATRGRTRRGRARPASSRTSSARPRTSSRGARSISRSACAGSKRSISTTRAAGHERAVDHHVAVDVRRGQRGDDDVGRACARASSPSARS